MVKRLSLIAVFAILGFGVFAYLLRWQDIDLKPMSFEYFLETLNTLNIKWSSFYFYIESLKGFVITFDFVQAIFNPFYLIWYSAEMISTTINLIFSLIKDFLAFIFGIVAFVSRLLYIV